MGTVIKHPVPDRVKPLFVIFDILALWRLALSVRVPGCQGATENAGVDNVTRSKMQGVENAEVSDSGNWY